MLARGAGVLLVVAACGAHPPGGPGWDGRIELLDGELSIKPPVAAKVLSNVPDGVMAAASSPMFQTIVELSDGVGRGFLLFRRAQIACGQDPGGAARSLAQTRRADHGAFHLLAISPVTHLYLLDQPDRGDKLTALGAIMTCSKGRLVYGDMFIEGEPPRWRRLLQQTARSLERGSSPPRIDTRRTTIEGCDTELTVTIPEGYLYDVEHGVDFTTHVFVRPERRALVWIYFGYYSRPRAPDTATSLDMQGVSIRRWEDDHGAHLERRWHAPSMLDTDPVARAWYARVTKDPSWQDDDENLGRLAEYSHACVVHARAQGVAIGEPALRTLISFTIAGAGERAR